MINKVFTVKNTLLDSLFAYPLLFKNKWDVYHHWFAVCGNGFDWIDGCLVDKSSLSRDFILTKEAAVEAQLDDFTMKVNEIDKAYGENAKFSDKEYYNAIQFATAIASKKQERIKYVDSYIDDFTPTNGEIYPLSNYSKIMQIPEDIQPDWLEACEEFYNYLVSAENIVDKEQQDYVKQIGELIEKRKSELPNRKPKFQKALFPEKFA